MKVRPLSSGEGGARCASGGRARSLRQLIHEETQMRAETTKLISEIEQSLGLLRRHL
jgi:hypothetical protein